MSNPLSYNKVTIFGESLCDYLWIYNDIASQEMIDESISTYNYEPEWINPTLLLALFNTNINGGNTGNLQENIINWLVYKQEPNSSILEFVASLPVSKNSIIDYKIQNNKSYKYVIFPLTNTTIGTQLAGAEYINVDWWSWSLIELQSSTVPNLFYVNTNNIWNFDLNVSANSFTQNLDKFQMNGTNKYSQFSSGKKNYLNGSISCLLGNLSNNLYQDTVEMQRQFRDFIANGNQKVLRDRKGNIFLIETTSNSFQFTDEIECQPTTINFAFTEIGSIENLSFIEE